MFLDLKIGSCGEEVKQLQQMLNYLGYNAGIVDGIFGVKTETALNEYKTFKYVNGIYDDNTSYFLTNDYIKKKSEEQKDDRIKILRRFDSDVYIFETKSDEFVDIELGEHGKLEPLSKITKEGKDIIAKINGVFFNFGATSINDEILGMLIDEGKYYKPSDGYISFIYYKNGTTDIRYVDNPEDIWYLKNNAYWVFGVAGWSLIKNGKKDLTNATKFSHWNTKQPRSLVGQRKDGNFVLVVVDGRIDNSNGITADESYEILKELDVWNGINLDGGYSSEMIYKDKIINKMAQLKGERPIGSALLVYKK